MSSLRTNPSWTSDELYFPPSHPLLRATFHSLRQAFHEKYPINQNFRDPVTGEVLLGDAFGRYPEDHLHFQGPPWFITTFAAVQFLLWDALHMRAKGEIEISRVDRDYFQSLDSGLILGDVPAHGVSRITRTDPRFQVIERGLVKSAKDIYLRIMVHAGNGNNLTEVFNPDTGAPMGLQNLTWSYVEALKTSRMLRQWEMRDTLSVRSDSCAELLPVH